MNKLLAKLPAFALPFVTRSLRGGRGRRYALMSLLIATATAMLGLWLALGSGSFEQSVRMELALEGNEWNRQRSEFVVFAHNDHERMAYEADARKIRRNPYADLHANWGEVAMLTRDGRYLLEDFAQAVNARTDEELALQARARAVLDPNGTIQDWSGYGRVSWDDPELRAQFERVLELEGVPEVKPYTSPLGLGDALTFVGFIAGLVLAACATVFAPLLVAIQQAQERHENTLTPLTGTGLRSRELAIGLASGPVAVVAIFAAPHLLMFAGCALLVGNGLSGLGLLAALAASGLFLIFAGQLLGHLIGHRRTPGIIAIAMMSVLGIAWLAGVALLTELERDTAGFAAVLPTLGLSGLLAHTFVDGGAAYFGPQAYFDMLLLATVAWSVAALVFAGLALAALSHEIEGRPGARLGRGATLLGALTCIGLMQMMIPFHVTEEGLRMYLGLGVLALPFAVLLMARVPVGDDPPRMRRVPVARLLGEFAGWCVAHVAVSTVLSSFDVGDTLHPVALIWMSWCVLVLGLMAIRVVSLQSSILSHLFLAFCGASLIMGFLQSAFWAFDNSHDLEDLFAMSQVSAVLGLLQIFVTVGIPLALVRSLRKKLGSLSAR
jgi:hypothetical protein